MVEPRRSAAASRLDGRGRPAPGALPVRLLLPAPPPASGSLGRSFATKPSTTPAAVDERRTTTGATAVDTAAVDGRRAA